MCMKSFLVGSLVEHSFNLLMHDYLRTVPYDVSPQTILNRKGIVGNQ